MPDRHARHDAKNHQNRGQRFLMPVKESPATIGDGGFAGPDRHACQIALDVLRELFDGTIPALGLLAQRLHHDSVEIAAQPALQFSRLQAALVAHRFRSNCSSCIAIARCLFFFPVNRRCSVFRGQFRKPAAPFPKETGPQSDRADGRSAIQKATPPTNRRRLRS